MNHQASPACSSTVPQLLVSVRDAQEAEAALAGGADWIDLKEPSAGPLAAVSVQTAREVARILAGRRILSAALGELCEWKQSSAQELLTVEGLRFVKLGLAGCAQRDDWQQQWLDIATAAANANKQLVAVLYADHLLASSPTPTEIITLAQQAETRYLLIDTFNKKAGTAFDHFTGDELGDLFIAARQLNLKIVLAGSLSCDLLQKLPATGVDMVAVRGAVCRGDRTAEIDVKLVASFRQALADRFAPSH